MRNTKESKNIPMKPNGINCPVCDHTNHSVINCISYIRCWNCGQILKGKDIGNKIEESISLAEK